MKWKTLVDEICYRTEDYTEFHTLTYIKQLLQALGYLHNLNIIHLNIRPENIILESDNLKLIDLTQSTAVNEQSPNDCLNDLIVNDEFSAPEIKDHRISLKSDVWSVGALTFTLINGDWEKKGEDLGVSEFCRDFWTKCLQLDSM